VVVNPLRWAPYVYADEELLTESMVEEGPVREALQRAAAESFGEE
jgi:hypothetical protein